MVVEAGFVGVVVFLGVTAAAAGFLVLVVALVLTLDYYFLLSVLFDSVELVLPFSCRCLIDGHVRASLSLL